MQGIAFYIGVDEMGRGPLAGPLYVCACGVSSIAKLPKVQKNLPIRDSKKLSEARREKWWDILEKERIEGNIHIAYASISPRMIDKKGVTYATRTGATESVRKVLLSANITKGKVYIQLDGSLFVYIEKLQKEFPKCIFLTKIIIRGDESIKIISFASIYGKVMRDRFMVRLGKKYPQFGFEIHKGYGTVAHRRVIKKFGASPAHRKLFIRNI